LNAPAVAPAVTVTEAGTVSAGLVFVSEIAAPPARAALVSVTVQALDAFEPKLAGVHTSEEINTGATSPIVWFAELPL
jgi:hypothetical protein